MTTKTLADLATTTQTRLLPADRCDKCNAQAYVRVVVKENGLELLFCGHHFTKNEMGLMAVAEVTDDIRHQLVKSF